MDELDIVDSYLLTCVRLQLAVAQEVTVGGSYKVQPQAAKLDVKTLYRNLREYSTTVGFDLSDFNYANFLNFLNAHRDQFDVTDGEIGVDVNLIGLRASITEYGYVHRVPEDPKQMKLFE